ncbi:transmembrane protein 170A isoform X2 [Myotis lucifugus]|uniref:transmembrane protein 170A isoform X2 n=1 Tax=Myotis lucifugus TaxID=59463 RepID=UPI0003BB7D8E|nr:transmembrane protein 170A isoform X2 [Myotis lucifugus]XP_059523398.1 transmembrane protein 170A isoform X2 [Myotis daubentonii]
MEHEGSGGSEGSAGLLQQILSLKLVPRVGNGTLCPNATSLCTFPATARRHSVDTGDLPCITCPVSSRTEMWYGVFLWALVSSLFFHVPAGLLALFTLRHHKYGAAIAGVYRAAGKDMIPFEALTLGTGQTFCVVVVSFLRILATL